ncbi:amyloid fiber anchoring/assembly protein TapA [Lentibacillus sp. N15]|uniref:amyloid fiber anchoring/assembly protein TapA n=1 Tax=Lentibacillus songyuanensis TaxID=3136161 RepID=UPI0031B9ECE6
MSRLHKFKKPKKLMMTMKLMAVFYLIIFTSSYLTSGTKAYFNNQAMDKPVIQVGEWWDQSDLDFTGKSPQKVKSCSPTNITVQLKNNGFTMIGTTEYEVYYTKKGNPRKDGKEVTKGSINPIKEGETTSLSIHVKNPGSYIFKVFQRPGYKDNDDSRHAIWSKTVTVKCVEDKMEEKQTDSTTKEKDQQKHKTDTSANKPKTENANGNKSKADQKESEQINGQEKQQAEKNSSDPDNKTEEKEDNKKIADEESSEATIKKPKEQSNTKEMQPGKDGKDETDE